MRKKSKLRYFTAIYLCLTTLTICNGVIFFSDFFEDFHEIPIDNVSNTPVYGAMYHASIYSDSATRASEVLSLPEGTIRNISTPSREFGSIRKFFISTKASDLSETIVVRGSHITDSFTGIEIGNKEPHKIVHDQGRFHIFPESKYKKHSTVLSERRTYEKQADHSDEVATVQQYLGTTSPREKEYIAKRRKETIAALAKFSGKKLTDQNAPRVSLAATSGGMRAFLKTIGVLRGLSKIGLLDGLEYTAGVSGGSWAIAFWLAEQTDIHTFSDNLKQRLTKMPRMVDLLSINDADISTVRKLSSTYRKKIFRLYGHRTHDLLTLYACFISYYLVRPFREDHQNLTFSDLATALDPKHHPLPICSAVTPHHLSNNQFHWLEFSPFDVRLVGGGYTIPTWAFLRRFQEGKSVNSLPEPFLGYFAALWGSFFSASIEDLLTKSPVAKHTEAIGKAFSNFGEPAPAETTTYNKKRFAATTPNFVHGMKDVPPKLSKKAYSKVIDGGHSNSIPINTYLHAGRQQDIIIIANASDSGFLDYQAMRRTRQVLKKYYPSIGIKITAEEGSDEHELDRILGKPFTYIPSTGRGIPAILHIALHPVDSYDPDYDPIAGPEVSTTNARYTLEESEKLMGLCEHIVIQNKGAFVHAVNRAVTQRS